MQFFEYGAAGLLTQAGAVLALPPAASGLTWILVLAEQAAPISLVWRNLSDRTLLVLASDGSSGVPIQDPAAVAATSLMVSSFFGRIRLIRLAPSDWATNLPTTFARPPAGMSPNDLAAQARTNGSLPAGFVAQRDI